MCLVDGRQKDALVSCSTNKRPASKQRREWRQEIELRIEEVVSSEHSSKKARPKNNAGFESKSNCVQRFVDGIWKGGRPTPFT